MACSSFLRHLQSCKVYRLYAIKAYNSPRFIKNLPFFSSFSQKISLNTPLPCPGLPQRCGLYFLIFCAEYFSQYPGFFNFPTRKFLSIQQNKALIFPNCEFYSVEKRVLFCAKSKNKTLFSEENFSFFAGKNLSADKNFSLNSAERISQSTLLYIKR